MEIFTGKAGLIEQSKFHIKIAGKTFSYIGENEQGFFLEELTWNAIVQSDIHRDAEYEVVVTTPDQKIYVSFRDNLTGDDGESTLSYSLDDVNEEQIAELLGDQIAEPKDVIFMEWVNNEMTVMEGEDNDEYVFTFNDLNPTPMVTGALKAKIWLKRNRFNILGIFLIISIPAASIPFGYKFLTEQHGSNIKKYNTEKATLVKTKEKTSKLISDTNQAYLKVLNVKDIFDSREGEKRLKKIFFKKKKILTKY